MKNNLHYHSMPIEDWEFIKNELKELKSLKGQVNSKFTVEITERALHSYWSSKGCNYYYSFIIDKTIPSDNSHVVLIEKSIEEKLKNILDSNKNLIKEILKRKEEADQAYKECGKVWETNRLLYDTIVKRGWFSTLVYKLFYDNKK